MAVLSSEASLGPALAQEPHPSVCVRINGRFRAHKNTGLQRYANELISRMAPNVQVIEPRSPLKGIRGHAWEQFALPFLGRGEVLWSPCNTGPCWVRKQVVTIHDVFPLDHPEWFSARFAAIFRNIIPRLVRTAHRIIAVSEYTRGRLISATGIPAEKVCVVLSGIGPQFVPASPVRQEEARSAAGIPAGKAYFLSVSSLEPRKNVARVLRAWGKAIPSLPPDLYLVMAGRAVDNSVFAAVDLGTVPERVIYTGYVADEHLVGLYSGARSFVFPSLAEGFGLPPLEAMACGTPVLTSRNSALEELSGPCALLVDPENEDEITRGIIRMAVDASLRRKLRECGLAHVPLFDWNTAAAQTQELLRETANSGRSAV